MLEMPESWDSCQGGLLTGSGTNSRDGSVLQLTKLNGVGDLKSVLTADMEMQFGVSPVGFQSCFSPVFPHYAPLLHFGMVTLIL